MTGGNRESLQLGASRGPEPSFQWDRNGLSEQHAAMQLLSVAQVAAILGVSAAWVRDHATRKQPHVKCVKVGKLLKFRHEDVEEFIRAWCQ